MSILNNKPLVSIGVPVYNGERHIRQALDALLAQDYENFELIISDNASTDQTQEICLKYAQRDKRVRYYRNQMNMGAIWNFNRAFELSSGEYFMWASHDDYWKPSYLRSCLDAFSTSEAIVLAGALCEGVDSETGESIRTFPELSTVGLSPCARFMRVGSMYSGSRGPNSMYYAVCKRNALREAMPLKRELTVGQLLVAELSLKGEFVTVPEKLMVKRINRVSRSSQAAAHTMGISRLHIWCRCEAREVMWLRIIFQSDRLGLHEKIMLAFWSLGKYVQFSVYYGPLPLLAYRILLTLCPKIATRARQTWLSSARGR
jgi:glycosyltransferase involved in cell wall biosynthesis